MNSKRPLAISCVPRFYRGDLATNDAKTDTFTEISSEYECLNGPLKTNFSGHGGVSPLSVSAKGKATASVSVSVRWPVLYEQCVYTGKVKAGQLTTVSGALVLFQPKPTKLKGQGCPQKKAELAFNVFTLVGPTGRTGSRSSLIAISRSATA